MASGTIKRAKTETLSLRLDPKTKFILEFVARIKGQSITTVVDRSVKDAAKGVVVEGAGFSPDRAWDDFWDVSEGMRTLNLIKSSTVPTSYEEDEIVRFTRDHWPFFYTSESMDVFKRHYVDLLWPKIETYLALWRDERHSNYWAAGESMRRDLSRAKILSPEWPIPRRSKLTETKETFAADLDDDIPF